MKNIAEQSPAGLPPMASASIRNAGDGRFQLILTQAIRDGTKIVREWHGREYEVVVRGEKYEYNGKLYRSLSGVARAITNTNWNGNEFFGIRKR